MITWCFSLIGILTSVAVDTSQFDKFTKHDYDQYIANKLHKNSMLEDADPVAWFSLTNDRTTVVDLGFR